ncbi:MAG: hypothetical protein HUJ62_09740, partial [Streptococcus gallolyticus]|nr:hypothetical protein [Streptococcus gallolyticus]
HTLVDAEQSVYEYAKFSDVPANASKVSAKAPFTEEQYLLIQLAFMGYHTPPRKVIVVMRAEKDVADYTNVMPTVEGINFDYLAFPQIEDVDVQTVMTWFKGLDKKATIILPNAVGGDSEKVVNFTTDNLKTTLRNDIFTTANYTARIAGLLAGTPMTISCTYAPLAEVLDFDRLSKDDMDMAVDNGEFILYHDGDKTKVARGVNSFQTTTFDKGEAFKKIKLVDCMNMIYTDVKKTCEDSYIGKYPNDYDSKCILMTAIQAYIDGLVYDRILDNSFANKVEIDLESQRIYLKSIGVDVDNMTDLEIKKCNTKDQVFLAMNIKLVDAIEDITLNVNI